MSHGRTTLASWASSFPVSLRSLHSAMREFLYEQIAHRTGDGCQCQWHLWQAVLMVNVAMSAAACNVQLLQASPRGLWCEEEGSACSILREPFCPCDSGDITNHLDGTFQSLTRPPWPLSLGLPWCTTLFRSNCGSRRESWLTIATHGRTRRRLGTAARRDGTCRSVGLVVRSCARGPAVDGNRVDDRIG